MFVMVILFLKKTSMEKYDETSNPLLCTSSVLILGV